MFTRIKNHSIEAIKYLGIATLTGSLSLGIIAIAYSLISMVSSYGGYIGLVAFGCLVGVGLISTYKANEEQRRRANQIEAFAAQFVQPGAPGNYTMRNFIPNNAQIEAWAKTPAGRDALYQLIKRGGKPSLASAAKPKATVEHSTSVNEPGGCGVVNTADNVRHIRAKEAVHA